MSDKITPMTWVPYESFDACRAAMNPLQRRLQVAHCMKVLDTLLLGDERAVRRSPAAQLWAGHGEWFTAYALVMIGDWDERSGFVERVAARMGMSEAALLATADQQVLETMHMNSTGMIERPHWLGDQRIHTSHRAAMGNGVKVEWSLLVWPDGIVLDAGNKSQPDKEEGHSDVGTRNDVIDQLRGKGYEGPVSYPKTKLEEMLTIVEGGGVVETPKRGRRPKAEGDTAAAGDADAEGDLPR